MPTVNPDKHEHLLELIRNLLALANSPNEFEAAAAAAKASELLMKYNLDRETVMGFRTPQERQADMAHERGDFGVSSVPYWYHDLLGALCVHNVCRYHWSHGGWSTASYTLYGQQAAIAVTKYQFDYLTQTLLRLAEESWKAYHKLMSKPQMGLFEEPGERANPTTSKREFVQSFYLGAVQVIANRLRELRKQENGQAQTQALVVVEKQALDAYYADQTRGWHFTYSRVGRASANSAAGFRSGREAGASVSIHTGLGGGGATKRIAAA